MASEHYFTSTPATELKTRQIDVRLSGREYTLTTANGVFSPDHIDDGTAELLYNVPKPPTSGDLLDIGCGWGPVALTLALEAPDATVWAVDVNERALELVRRNAEKVGVSNVNAVKPEDVPADVRFATVWSNPPIRIGKDALHELLRLWLPRVADDGDAWLVVQKNLGADSLHRWLREEFPHLTVTREGVGKGYRVLRAVRP
ncbi:class I SAM-dependent methyltransferase [Glaciibacter flavus]|uniref:class I SAM-dependent methyltransferase n=1 Tax=Orlajensenia flava TaxID=2565934 RepID=UPI003AFF8376